MFLWGPERVHPLPPEGCKPGLAMHAAPFELNALASTWVDRLWVIPVLSAVAWLGMLVAMLGYWICHGRPIYDTMRGTRTVPFISDIGSEAPKPLFILGSIVAMVLLTLSTALRQWPRPSQGKRKNLPGRICAGLATMLAGAGSTGIILSSIYDSAHHLDLHNSLSLVFITSYLASGICICAEYIRVGRACNWQHKRLVEITATRISLVIVEAILSIVFRSAALRDETKEEAAIIEWVVAYLFTGHILSFVTDLRPGFRAFMLAGVDYDDDSADGWPSMPVHGMAALEEAVPLRCEELGSRNPTERRIR